MTMRHRMLTLGICLLSTATLYADHVLTDSGRVLLNVTVAEPGGLTPGQMVRVRTFDSSFEFDPRTNAVTILPRHSVVRRVAGVITTSTVVAREGAVALVDSAGWRGYSPPYRPALVAPTPAPKATPVPVAMAEKNRAQQAASLNVVPETVPLAERLDRQLEIFMAEQTRMVQDASTSRVQGLMSPDSIKMEKIQLLMRQKSILERFFPQADDTVKLAVDYWKKQVDKAQVSGQFDMEGL